MSFPRLDSPPQHHTAPDAPDGNEMADPDTPFFSTAATELSTGDEDEHGLVGSVEEPTSSHSVVGTHMNIPQTLDDLPIEIRSLTERFLDSLSAKVHAVPLNIEALGQRYQEFYRRAEKPIAIHIAALNSKLSRGNAVSSNVSKSRGSDRAVQQMLTTTELNERKKARKLLQARKLALEEAVERAVCEKLYLKLWHHRNSDDEQADQKLRSRVAALSLVGIGIKELLASGLDDIPDDVRTRIIQQEVEIKQSLSAARNSVQQMAMVSYPLGKLNHLVNAHKNIVGTLSDFFPSSSSADEVLPTIIYTLITSPPESINVISDLHFIQRFRNSHRIDGEAAYCITNLEAAISFLETVELPSLRADESLQGPEKNGSTHSGSSKEAIPMQLGITPIDDPLFAEPCPIISDQVLPVKPKAIQNKSSRSLSELIQAQTNKLEAASDSLRGAVLDSADQAVGALNNTIENSFRFLFGRIRDEQQTEAPLPKTLEDARKLVATPPPLLDDDASATSPRSEDSSPEYPTKIPRDSPSTSQVLNLVGGRRVRERRVDSSRPTASIINTPSATSITDSLSDTTSASLVSSPTPLPSSSTENVSISPLVASPGNVAVEGLRSLSSSLNPLNQFAKISLFGRIAAPMTISNSSSDPTRDSSSHRLQSADSALGTKFLPAIEEIRKMPCPSTKFIECRDARNLRISDLDELLAEYQKMAAAVKKVQEW